MNERLFTNLGNLVDDYMLGNTRIKIYDGAYAGRTENDIDIILKKIAEIGVRAYIEEDETLEESVS
ncbi:MAG TPA: hypothetical protein GXZ27_09310 [Thermoanaerobacterales bacterium]|nr:hypothetical protein [Thermoanaerobacterales bacterium]